MPSLLDRLTARVAYLHARRVFARFERALDQVERAQSASLARALRVVAHSAFGRQHGLARVRTPVELTRAVPIQTYEDVRPFVERVHDGDARALLSPGQRLLMFATTSGTTARRKLIPVTAEFVRDYRRGWNTFGLKMLTDHPAAILRAILQSSGRYDEERSAAGVPIGAITGLLARTQKRIVRRYYVAPLELANVTEHHARQYALMRFAMARDVAFAVTANPATLVQLARLANEESERLIRDVRDGTLSREVVPDEPGNVVLRRKLRPDRARAAELARLRDRHGALRPRDYWRLEFLACWTGGSMGYYLERLAEWWGPLPVRDVGLLASEGRVSLPLVDNLPAGVLDVTSGCFEFIPIELAEQSNPSTCTPRELSAGRDYVVVLTNTSGLVRYRLDDVVRVCGFVGEAPVIEFLYRAGRVASVAGEKLTENQLTSAVAAVRAELGVAEFDYVCAPQWGDPPFYRLSAAALLPAEFGDRLDAALAGLNDEYSSRRKSRRLSGLVARGVDPRMIAAMDRRMLATRRSTAEQYKRQTLLTQIGDDDRALVVDAG